jgi:rhodanese-related sulfurtransferase
MNRRRFLVVSACAAALIGGGTAWLRAWAGDAPALAADEAARRMANGAVTLLDVRSAAEWRATGIPAGAKPVTIHDPGGIDGFVAAAAKAVGGDRSAPVAVICRTGRRSTAAADALLRAGFTKVYNVREGMGGNPIDGAGWLARGLKTEQPES